MRPSPDLALDHYAIINPLIKWRILSLPVLMFESGYEKSYNGFCQLIKAFEKRKIINSCYTYNPLQKFLFLNPDFSKKISTSKSELDISTLLHEAVTANVCRTLLKNKLITDCELSHEFSDHKNWNYPNILDPDATLFAKFKTDHLNIAIEIELTQKSRSRVYQKFNTYIKSEYFNSVLYFFSKKEVFNSYIARIEELKSQNKETLIPHGINRKIFLIYKNNLLHNKLSLDDASVYINSTFAKFGDLYFEGK